MVVCLSKLDSGSLLLEGSIHFDNAVEVECQGRKILESAMQESRVVEIKLSKVMAGGSAALSVLLCWSRWVTGQGGTLRLVEWAPELLALRQLCGLDAVLR